MKVKIKNNNVKNIKLYPNKICGGYKVQQIGRTSDTDSNKENRLNHNVQGHEGMKNDVQELKQFLHGKEMYLPAK